MAKKLTARQQLFCEEYLKDLNAHASAVRAGYSAKSDAAGSKLMANPMVAERIKELMQERVKRLHLDQDYVVKTLMEVVERCMQRQPVRGRWNRDTNSFEQAKDEFGNDVWQFDSHGASKALELLGRHLGIFEKDNRQSGQKIVIKRKQ